MKECILQVCNVEISVWSTKNWRSNGGLNLDKFEIFWDIYTTLCPRHFGMKPRSKAYEPSYRDWIVWTTKNCWKNGVLDNLDKFEIFWNICTAQKDNTYMYIVTLCGLIYKGNGVRKPLWERHLFWPASFNRQLFVIKKVVHRLGASHLWCLCFYVQSIFFAVISVTILLQSFIQPGNVLCACDHYT